MKWEAYRQCCTFSMSAPYMADADMLEHCPMSASVMCPCIRLSSDSVHVICAGHRHIGTLSNVRVRGVPTNRILYTCVFFKKILIMPPLAISLDQYIIKTKEKINKSNLKVYCKACIKVLGRNEGEKIFFPNKMDRIIQHLKKCVHFAEKMTPEQKKEIFGLSKNSEASQTREKRPGIY